MDERARREIVEAENERLRDRVQQLEEVLFETAAPIPIEWRLTALEARMFGFLASRERASRASLMTVLYEDRAADGDVPEPKIVDVLVCHLRKKLPAAVKVLTIWGYGFALDPESRARFGRHGKAAAA